MKKRIKLIVVIAAYLFFASYVFADENWRVEFDNLCGKTEETMTMKAEELKDLIDRCDKLRPVIEKSENPQKQLFLKRLEKCRNLFVYMLEVKVSQ